MKFNLKRPYIEAIFNTENIKRRVWIDSSQTYVNFRKKILKKYKLSVESFNMFDGIETENRKTDIVYDGYFDKKFGQIGFEFDGKTLDFIDVWFTEDYKTFKYFINKRIFKQ
jgi:hypothetical protein